MNIQTNNTGKAFGMKFLFALSMAAALPGNADAQTGNGLIEGLVARVENLEKQAASFPPVGTVIAFHGDPEEFSRTVPSAQKWVRADGVDGVPNLEKPLTPSDIVIGTAKHGEPVSRLVESKEGDEWIWFVSNRDTMGSRDGKSPGHYEWSEDHFQHRIEQNGTVIAQGRTFDWKPGHGWAKWKGGEANVLGIRKATFTRLTYFIRVE